MKVEHASKRRNSLAALAGSVASHAASRVLHNMGRRASQSEAAPGKQEQGVSQYHDIRTLYKAKRMSKKKKRAIKFQKKVVKAMVMDSPNQITLSNHSGTMPSATAGTQSMVMFPGLYTFNGNSTTAGQQDMFLLLNNTATAVNLAGTVMDYSPLNSKVEVTSAHMDLLFTTNSTSPMFLDLYEVLCRADDIGYGNVTDYIHADQSNQTWGSGAALAGTTFGVTPFQLDSITKNFKILNKTRHYIQGLGSLSVSMHDKRVRTIKGEWFLNTVQSNMVARKGWTKTWIAVTFGSPQSGTTDQTSSTMFYAITKTYNARIINSTPITGTLPGTTGW